MRGRLSKAAQLRHPDAPVEVQWHRRARRVRWAAARLAARSRVHPHLPPAPSRPRHCSGVILPHGVTLTNGTWSPRHEW